MQEKLSEIGKVEFDVFVGHSVGWEDSNTSTNFVHCRTYRLRPDYEEKPEIVECEVKERDGDLWWYSKRDNPVASIDRACRLPDFIGFKYADGNIYPQPVMYSENGGLHFISQIKSFASGKDIANRPTHVLFQVTK
jgi:hypothetical protein